MGDTAIFIGMLFFFILLGAALPYINHSFDDSYSSSTSSDSTIDEATEDFATNPSSVSALSVFGSMATIFFWTFGNVPAWLDATFFMALRGIFVWLGIRVARGV